MDPLFLTYLAIPALIMSAITFYDYSAVNDFNNPISPDAELLKYNDSFYRTSLASAWINAEKAKREAVHISFGISISGFNISLTLIQDYYNNAMSSAHDVFSQLKTRVVADYILLDRMGADNNASAGVPRQKLEKIRDLADAFESYDVQSCSRDLSNVFNRVSCVQWMMSHKLASVRDGIKLYNLIVSLDKSSLLNKFEEIHKEALEAEKMMKEEYAEQSFEFERLSLNVTNLISKISYESIGLIEPESERIISISRVGEVVPKKSGPLKQRVSWLKDDFDFCQLDKKHADKTFSSKEDDYLFLATQETSSVNWRLKKSAEEAQSIIIDAENLRSFARQRLKSLLDASALATDPLFIEAKEKYERAFYEKTGDAINDYAEGIKLMDILSSNSFDFEERAVYAMKLVSSLESAGYDVSFERARICELRSANNFVSARNAYAELGRLISSLKEKMKPMIAVLSEKREKSRSMMSSAGALLQALPDFSAWEKTQSFNASFSVSIAKDEYSNYDELSALYSQIISYYTRLFSEKASEVLSEGAEVKLFFSKTPECNRKASADAALIITNTLPILVESAAVEEKFLNETLTAVVSMLEPNKKMLFSKKIELTPLVCSAQQNQDIEGIFAAKISVQPVLNLSEAFVVFSIPQNIVVLSVFPPSEFNGTHYLARDLKDPQEIIIQYRISEDLMQPQPVNISNASLADEEIAVNFSNEVESICFFVNCSLLRQK
ncbi:MAG: hypothetical protein QXO69_02835, partial [archaeon]